VPCALPVRTFFTMTSRRRRGAAPRAGDSARPPASGRPRPARAGPHALSLPLVYWAHPGTHEVLTLPSSLTPPCPARGPPRQWRSLRSRRCANRRCRPLTRRLLAGVWRLGRKTRRTGDESMGCAIARGLGPQAGDKAPTRGSRAAPTLPSNRSRRPHASAHRMEEVSIRSARGPHRFCTPASCALGCQGPRPEGDLWHAGAFLLKRTLVRT